MSWVTFSVTVTRALAEYAIAASVPGNRRGDNAQAACGAVCARCENLKLYEPSDFGKAGEVLQSAFGGKLPVIGTCGRIPHPSRDLDPGTCGCVVLVQTSRQVGAELTVKGRGMKPAGKLEVLAERCPSGRWQ